MLIINPNQKIILETHEFNVLCKDQTHLLWSDGTVKVHDHTDLWNHKRKNPVILFLQAISLYYIL